MAKILTFQCGKIAKRLLSVWLPIKRTFFLLTIKIYPMKKYVVDVTYSLEGNNYTEVVNSMPCTCTAFNSLDEAIKEVENDIELGYNNKNYRGLQVHFSPLRNNEYFWHGCFECAYIFGPKVRYDVRIKQIEF